MDLNTNMNLIERLKIKYNYLFEEQTCRFCGKKYFLTNKQIYCIYRKIQKHKQNFVCCSTMCSRKLQMKILGPSTHRPDVIEKIRISKLNNIDENGFNSYQRQTIRCKKTKKERYGNENYNNMSQIRKTSDTVGSDGLTSNKRGAIRCKKTKKERYGNENYNNSKKGVQTKLNNIDENGLNNYQRGVIKSKKTTFEKLGVEHHTQSQRYKELIKDKDKIYNSQKKAYETRKRNKTFNSRSKSEIRCYELLKTKFKDVEHSYRDENRYPFNCDMYIPSKDLFIECHFGWAHGGAPFNKNNKEHLKE